jgi:ABC-type branched-subunit amino acid transport system permease subunit
MLSVFHAGFAGGLCTPGLYVSSPGPDLASVEQTFNARQVRMLIGGLGTLVNLLLGAI